MLEAAPVLLQRLVPAAEHLQRVAEVLARQRFVLERADLLVDAHALLEQLRGRVEVAAAVLDDADVVVRRGEVPQIALGSRSAPGCAEVLQRRVPVAELPERVAEVHRRPPCRAARSRAARRWPPLPRGCSRERCQLPRGELDQAEDVLHVAVDDGRLHRLQHRPRARRRIRARCRGRRASGTARPSG